MKNKTKITHPENLETKYNGLISSIETLLNDARSKVVREVNQTIVLTYWHIGKYIVEYEQGGKERAEYGTELLRRLSQDLTKSFGKGFSYRNLRLIRQFYTTFANWQSVIANSQGLIVPSPMAQSEDPKWQSLSAKSQNSIVPTTSAQSTNSKMQSAFVKLSWTHFVRLLSVKNEGERNFYLIETAENNWSVRELDRQINSSLFERLLLSKDKKGIHTLAKKGQIIENAEDVLKNPYILEFLGLEESKKYSENELETAIIDNLEKFLLELGKGFSFVERQKRFSAGTDADVRKLF